MYDIQYNGRIELFLNQRTGFYFLAVLQHCLEYNAQWHQWLFYAQLATVTKWPFDSARKIPNNEFLNDTAGKYTSNFALVPLSIREL